MATEAFEAIITEALEAEAMAAETLALAADMTEEASKLGLMVAVTLFTCVTVANWTIVKVVGMALEM